MASPLRSQVFWLVLALAVPLNLLGGCTGAGPQGQRGEGPNAAPTAGMPSGPVQPGGWSIALHGGAGTLDRDSPPELIRQYQAALAAALDAGAAMLNAGSPALDVAVEVVRRLEDDPLFNAGVGAALTIEGKAELDAAVMDGRALTCGAVAGVTTVKNPVSLARLVMERTPHVLLARDGAEAFATSVGVPRVDNSYFVTPRRRQMLEEMLRSRPGAAATPREPVQDSALVERSTRAERVMGTVGCVVRDRLGNLAAATSTGGLTGKRFGRIGDTPLIGSGTYASNSSCAVCCTGTGEEFIRHAVARTVAARMELAGEPLAVAADVLIHRTLKPDDGGLIAVSRDGSIAMPYNSEGMYRAAANSGGLRLVKIWQ